MATTNYSGQNLTTANLQYDNLDNSIIYAQGMLSQLAQDSIGFYNVI